MSKRPVILTVKGRAAAIVQDTAAYQRLLDIAARADAREGIRQGLEESKQGLGQEGTWAGRDLGRTRRSSSRNSKRLMAYRIKLMPRAQRDLADLYAWTGTLSSQAAVNWYHGLRAAVRSPQNRPNRCPVTPEAADLPHLLYGRNLPVRWNQAAPNTPPSPSPPPATSPDPIAPIPSAAMRP